MSSDHDLWGTDNSSFLEELATTRLSPLRPVQKRKRSISIKPDPGEDSDETDIDVNPTLLFKKPEKVVRNIGDEDYVYGAATFGGFGDYMARKRAKLQIQNNTLVGGEDEGTGTKSEIFKGVAIYVNGFTDPPFQDLREMIMAHGGVFHAYLDRKTMVTHIVASQLTPAKILEYQKGKMKVVKPTWIVKSVEMGVRQRWQEHALKAEDRYVAVNTTTPSPSVPVTAEATFDVDQAASVKKLPQTSLFDAFASQKPPTSSVIPAKRPLSSPEALSTSHIIAFTSRGGKKVAPRANHIPEEEKSSGLSPSEHRSASPEGPNYALHDSNPVARELMTSTQWRNEHTAANAAAFTESYFQNSRLHHLSTWKSELKKLVLDARERAERGEEEKRNSGLQPAENFSMQGLRLPMPSRKGKEKATDPTPKRERVIMHCDFDSFFVAAGLIDRPDLRGKPVVVCHGAGGKASTSEIASASYEARAFGIKNGMSLGQGRQLCSTIHTIPYDFEKYKTLSLKFYTILMEFADDLQAVSVDEALLDVSERVANMSSISSTSPGENSRDYAIDLAEAIRDRVREETSCEISVGISHNIMLARLATRKAKPAKSYHLLPAEVESHISPLGISAVHGVGYSIREKVKEKYGIETLGELLRIPKDQLQRFLGDKTGEKMWKAARGVDDTPLESDKPRKSVSAEVNYGIRFETNDQAETFVMTLGAEVAKRLSSIGRKGRQLTMKIMTRRADAPVEAPKFMGHGRVDSFSKTTAISGPRGTPTDDPETIGREAWKILQGFKFDPKELRGIGIQIQKLGDEQATRPGAELSPGQKLLDFTRLNSGPEVPDAQVPSTSAVKPSDGLMPTMSQIDPSVLECLPEDIRTEILWAMGPTGSSAITMEEPVNAATAPPSRAPSGFVDEDEDIILIRSQSLPVEEPKRGSLRPRNPTNASKSMSVSPNKLTTSRQRQVPKPADVKHITKQLAPRRKAPFISPSSTRLFQTRPAPKSDIADVELRAMGVDPIFFRELPQDVQGEQLEILRREFGSRATFRGFGGKDSEARSRSTSMVPLAPKTAPIPIASYSSLPTIKKLTRVEDVQDMVTQWLKYREDQGPIPAEVERIATYLVKCAATDIGLQQAASILRWWRQLLRDRWRSDEHLSDVLDVDAPGQIWWAAFVGVKRKVDAVTKTRFGSGLGLGK